MTKRTESQITGSKGQSLVSYLINDSGHWIARAQDEDYGIDLEAELSSPEVQGQLLKIQIKASKSVKVTDKGIPFRIDRKLISYADTCRLPVILVRVDLEQEQAWYLWLQRWLMDQRLAGTSIPNLPETVSDFIPAVATLQSGLENELQDVARWQTDTQLVITVNDAIRTAASVHDIDVLNHLVALLDRLKSVSDEFPIDLVIERVLALGPAVWATHEGNQASRTLYTICRHFGKNFNAEQIWRMAVRDDSCSRTGINALGILYDEYFEHMSKLNLVALFVRHTDSRIAYYCHIRERFPGDAFIECVDKAGDIEFAGLVLHTSLKEDFMSKWPNRGDSVLLDYLAAVAEQ